MAQIARQDQLFLGSKKIGNGSKGALSITAGIYNREDGKGVMLFLNGIQITKFVEYPGADAGFGELETEEGYGLDGDGFEDQTEAESSSEAKPRL